MRVFGVMSWFRLGWLCALCATPAAAHAHDLELLVGWPSEVVGDTPRDLEVAPQLWLQRMQGKLDATRRFGVQRCRTRARQLEDVREHARLATELLYGYEPLWRATHGRDPAEREAVDAQLAALGELTDALDAHLVEQILLLRPEPGDPEWLDVLRVALISRVHHEHPAQAAALLEIAARPGSPVLATAVMLIVLTR